jgi:hypothetical protein
MNHHKQLPTFLQRLAAQAGVAGGLFALCILAFGWQAAPAQADGNVIRVPGDYPTIQQAIDAAAPGDTIQVVGQDEFGNAVEYPEQLAITKSLTLVGNLSPSYTVTSTQAVIDAQHAGRAVTIWVEQPVGALRINPSVAVTMEGFYLEGGNATGLGGAELITAELPSEVASVEFAKGSWGRADEDTLAGAAALDTATLAREAAANLQRLHAQGQLPGGTESYAQMMARIEELAAAAEAAQGEAAQLQSAEEPPGAPAPVPMAVDVLPAADCGGGLYSKGASLTLKNVIVANSTANETGFPFLAAGAMRAGYGGGICIVQAPLDSVTLEAVILGGNVASTGYNGYGGGLLLQDTQGAQLRNVSFQQNYAMRSPDYFGFGGAIALDHAPNTVIDGSAGYSIFLRNVASLGRLGYGGAIYSTDSPGLKIGQVQFDTNIAAAGRLGARGVGGALRIFRSQSAEIDGARFVANVASTSGSGVGGGVAVLDSQRIRVARSVFERNVAAQGPGNGWSGAIELEQVQLAAVVGNQLLGNVGVAYPNMMGGGGALGIWDAESVHVIDNDFAQNVGASSGVGYGGAMMVSGSRAVTVTNNHFDGNWAAMFGILSSAGGAMQVQTSRSVAVSSNSFSANMAVLYSGSVSQATTGEGGALVGYAVDDMLVASNVFSGNVVLMTGQTALGTEGVDGGAIAINHGRVDDLNAAKADGASRNVSLLNNEFRRNLAILDALGSGQINTGGAVRLTAVGAVVHGNRFVENATCRTGCEGQSNNGGGLAVLPALDAEYVTSADTLVDGNAFLYNQGGAGAAMFFDSNLFTVTNNLVVASVAADKGDAGLPPTAVDVGLYLPLENLTLALVANNTLYANAGVGFNFDGWDDELPPVVNNIIVSHTVGVATARAETVVDLRYNLFNDNGEDVAGPGTITNTHAITGPVRFVNADAGLYYLMPNSMALNAGDPSGTPPAPQKDIDGVSRPYGPHVDIGAYEWHGQGAILPVVWK